MKMRAIWATTALLFVAPLTALGEPTPAPPLKSADSCATVTGTARSEAYAYSHYVELKNGCDKPVTCEVWTDVDPTPHQTLAAKPGETASVLIRRGSPAREVTAFKSCKFSAGK